MSSKYFYFIISAFCLYYTSSCQTSLDIIRKGEPIPQKIGYLKLYPDSNIFIFDSKIGEIADGEKIDPKHFKIVLPKGLRYYEVSGLSDFTFYYPNDQTIYLKVNYGRRQIVKESYKPKRNEIVGLLQSLTHHSDNKKFRIEKIKYKSKAMHLVVKNMNMTILFYNVEVKNYQNFLDSFSEIIWLAK